MKENLVFNFNRFYIGLFVLSLILLSFFFRLDLLLYLLVTYCIFYEIYKSGLLKLNNILYFFIIYISTLSISYYFYNLSTYFVFISIILLVICFLFPKKINLTFSIFLILIPLIIFNLFLIDRNLVYLVIIISFYNDTLAFIFGNLFKGPLIIPSISPKKTWTGTLSSLFLTSILLFFLDYYFLLAIFISASLFLGDLFFSYIKRKIGIKDFSNILYSHGGILDRIDSMSFLFTIFLYINL